MPTAFTPAEVALVARMDLEAGVAAIAARGADREEFRAAVRAMSLEANTAAIHAANTAHAAGQDPVAASAAARAAVFAAAMVEPVEHNEDPDDDGEMALFERMTDEFGPLNTRAAYDSWHGRRSRDDERDQLDDPWNERGAPFRSGDY